MHKYPFSILRIFFILTICFSLGSCAFHKSYTAPSAAPEAAPEEIVKHNGKSTPTTTREKYGKSFIYYDFSRLPDPRSLVLNEEIPLPSDLKKFIDTDLKSIRIKDKDAFEKEFWKEATKLGYSRQQLEIADYRIVIRAIMDVVASRITYLEVDSEKKAGDFIRQYGIFIPKDEYFRLGKGDCDKYRDISIAIYYLFFKDKNPQLKNIYLCSQIGGNSQPHAWVAILIPQRSYLLVSHCDPTFYDSGAIPNLDADDYHVCLYPFNVFLGNFYYNLIWTEYSNAPYTYDLFKAAYPNIFKDSLKSQVLRAMVRTTLQMADKCRHYISGREISQKAEWATQEFYNLGTRKGLASILRYNYEIYCLIGNKQKADEFRIKLQIEFPNSDNAKLTCTPPPERDGDLD